MAGARYCELVICLHDFVHTNTVDNSCTGKQHNCLAIIGIKGNKSLGAHDFVRALR